VTRVLVVAGTDTGVGKTVVTAALAALSRARGERVAVVKPAQTGVGPREPGDLEEVRRLSGVADLHELARFSDPLAPATAARRAGVPPPSVEDLVRAVGALTGRDRVLIEGAGGLLVHLDASGRTLADLAMRLGVPVLVVARAGLGTLNACALTCEVLRARGVDCLGIVIGAWPADPDLAAVCNLDDLPSYTGRPLLGRLPAGAGRLTRHTFLEAARAGLAPELGGEWGRFGARSPTYA
jgi:dethiobiotin synthetase